MATFRKYPSIEQFRKAFSLIKRNFYSNQDPNSIFPTISFKGTVKLHGTNAGIGFLQNEIWAQSRNNILDENNQNSGFYSFVFENEKVLKSLYQSLYSPEKVYVFGEWCGKNIQKGVALSDLPKMFVVFDVLVIEDENERWLPEEEVKKFESIEHNIYNIYSFTTWTITIDFNNPQTAIETLEKITLEVENECPVASSLGSKGIGEGVVWHTHHEQLGPIRFKVKGEKHSIVNTKKMVTIDPEKMDSLKKFVEYTVTEERLKQGIQENFGDSKITLKEISCFLKWIEKDIIKEESDTLKESGLSEKEVIREVKNEARKWFLNNHSSD